jgi:hypothetical protein
MDVFSETNTFLASADRYETVLVAAHRNPLRALLVADLTFEEAVGGFDIILVAGAPTPPEVEPEPSLVGWAKSSRGAPAFTDRSAPGLCPWLCRPP